MANGQFVADIPGAVERGQQFAQQEALRPLQQQQAQLGIQSQQQQFALGQQRGQIQQQQIQDNEKAQLQKDFVISARQLQDIPDKGKLSFLLRRRQELASKGRDTSDTDIAIGLAQDGNFTELNNATKDAVNFGRELGLLGPAPKAPAQAKGFTLSPGQQRFGASGELIAEVAPAAVGRATTPEQKVIPQVLLTGLSPDVAEQGAAAFTAAGGGKDGLSAFQKIVDKGTEQQRRLASPQILKSSFPKASPAETVQLQAVMDAAKTTEAGLKAAGKVREEQRRNVKAKGFQIRAVELLTSILANDELDDVLGSIEGAIDIRFQDSESELIADIEEAGNILTADNLSLMSGVLSESDIKILKNLAGGGLIRTRSLKRFTDDVTKLRDKLSSQQVVTVDDQEAARSEVKNQAIPTAPPSGREGGQLMTDSQGNKAFVFPDGTFEEVQ